MILWRRSPQLRPCRRPAAVPWRPRSRNSHVSEGPQAPTVWTSCTRYPMASPTGAAPSWPARRPPQPALRRGAALPVPAQLPGGRRAARTSLRPLPPAHLCSRRFEDAEAGPRLCIMPRLTGLSARQIAGCARVGCGRNAVILGRLASAIEPALSRTRVVGNIAGGTRMLHGTAPPFWSELRSTDAAASAGHVLCRRGRRADFRLLTAYVGADERAGAPPLGYGR